MNVNQPAERLLGFVQHLRDEGFSIGIRETMDMLSCLDNDDLHGRTWTRNVIRSLACHSHSDWQKFDGLFLDYWLVDEEISEIRHDGDAPAGSSRVELTGIGGSSQETPEQMGGVTGLKGSGAGRQKTISKADFRFLGDRKAMLIVEKLAEHLALRLRQRLTRKQRIRPHGNRLAIRQTIRRNLSHGGLPVKTCYRVRRREPLHLVILHDVSHSMAWNNPLLFRFVRGLVRTFRTSEAFAFHTRLFRVTDYYRERSLQVMKQKLENRNRMFMGGTCIAESIESFNREFSGKMLTRHSVVLIISDGFDTNEPDYLARELEILKRASDKIIWLNPMLGREGYDPDKKTLRAAMPFIDRHASANNLESLKKTADYIARECS